MKKYLLKNATTLLIIITLFSFQSHAATGTMIIGGISVPNLSADASGTEWTWNATTETLNLTATYAGGTTTQIQFMTLQGTGGANIFKNVFINANGTGIDDLKVQSSTVYAQGNHIIIKNIESSRHLFITDISGRTIYNNIINNTETSIPVTASGVYIVRVGGQTAKVICK